MIRQHRIDKFIALNKESKIYKGAHVNKTGRIGGVDADRLRLWFVNGKTFTLSSEEWKFVLKSGYPFVWVGE